jgi:hypothetical protein
MTLDQILRDFRKVILRIAADHGAQQVSVFGSTVRGEAGPDSDVDLLGRLEPERRLLDLGAIKQDLEALLGCEADVVTEASLSPYIRETVLKEAVSL